jgi:hypothetical protein
MTTRKIRRPGSTPEPPDKGQAPSFGGLVRQVDVGVGLPPVEELEAELEAYMDVLMGRVPPPIDAGTLTLMEVADAYFARANEIQFQIHKKERTGDVFRGSTYYKFRTGELRAFLELSKKAAELGSRRLTHARLLHDMANDSQGLMFFDED